MANIWTFLLSVSLFHTFLFNYIQQFVRFFFFFLSREKNEYKREINIIVSRQWYILLLFFLLCVYTYVSMSAWQVELTSFLLSYRKCRKYISIIIFRRYRPSISIFERRSAYVFFCLFFLFNLLASLNLLVELCKLLIIIGLDRVKGQ